MSRGPLPKVEVLLKFLDINMTLTTPHEQAGQKSLSLLFFKL